MATEKKLSAYQKLKLKLAEEKQKNELLRKDLYKFLDGDFGVTTHYKMLRQAQQGFEQMIWAGESSKNS